MSFELLGDALIPPVINKPMDILFMDAPYAKGLWEMALPAFDKHGWIDENTWVIIEIDNQEEVKIPTGFTLIQNRRQGRNTFLCLQKEI
jgi:16S rRNA (guanine966-N2)-methyltransferase